MGLWRLLGRLTLPRSTEEARAQTLDGWNPWRHAVTPLPGTLVVPDPTDAARSRHVAIGESGPPGEVVVHASLNVERDVWFFVPAAPGDDGAFEAREPRYAGFWRRSPGEESSLPWPEPDWRWTGRARFLGQLAIAEARAEKIMYRGISPCRLCGCHNGNVEFELDVWAWPEGFRHYVEAHGVRPTADFVAFVAAEATEGG